MKVGPNANFPVAVRRESTEVVPQTAHLYENVFDVTLNMTVHIAFVPDVSDIAPPWDTHSLPPNIDIITRVSEARMVSALLSTYVVTPNDEHAGTQERSAAPASEFDGVVFYVTHAEFEQYRIDLNALSDITGATLPGVKVNDLRGHDVVAFIERRILGSPWLRPEDATMLGRPTPSVET